MNDEDFIHNKFGYCYYQICKDSALIYGLYVEPEHRRQGNAKRLLQLVVNEIRYTGYAGDINVQVLAEEPGIETRRLIQLYKAFNLTII